MWSWVRRTASAALGEDTNRVGTAPMRRSSRPLRPCLASRSRIEMWVSAPMRWRWPMMGSLPGGEGGSGSRCCCLRLLAEVVPVRLADTRRMTRKISTPRSSACVAVPWSPASCR
uniref:Uncharacterized protein n=1 Tax=Zea mays TaxID=4577 RepID=C4J7W8_MAIZE|nr:unknown [Zea mays]ACR37276.1 unknown [Zea mays]